MSNFSDPHVGFPPPDLDYFGWSRRRVGDTDVICLTGELDRDAVAHLSPWLMRAAGASTAATVVLDLSDLRFIDAGCVRVIVDVWATATSRGRHLWVDGLQGTPERVFAILGLMPMLLDRAEARGGVRGAPVTETDGWVPHDDVSPADRRRHADRAESEADDRERLADERERLADERERLADEREALADERERMADRQELALDSRSSEFAARVTAAGAGDDRGAEEQADVAVRRAEAAVRRAEAELDRTRQAAARIRARAALRAARAERAATVRADRRIVDAHEAAWAADRRDFVAAERDARAGERDAEADAREAAARRRERLADQRERDLLEQERRLDGQRPAGRSAAGPDPAVDTPVRAAGKPRARATTGRAARMRGPQEYGPMLLASFAPLARQLFDNDDLPAALARVLKFTVEAVPGCDCASVTLVRRGRVVRTVTSGADAAELDEIQFATGLGPVPEAMYGEDSVYVPDLPGAAHRWPVLAAAAGELGMCSALCFGLYVTRPAQWSAIGSFTLYATTPDAFSDDDHDFGSILSAYLAVAVAAARRHDEVDRREAALHRALSSRDVIGQAKGILMERRRLSAGEAFDQLRRVSQQLNRKLVDVADQLAETGELPHR